MRAILKAWGDPLLVDLAQIADNSPWWPGTVSQTRKSFISALKSPAIFRRVFSGDGNVQLHQVAIGAAAETRAMHISQRDDSSSLLPISSVQTTMFPGTAEVAR